MKKLALNLAILVLTFLFIFFVKKLECVWVLAFFIFYAFCFYLEIFSYKFAYKTSLNKAIFKDNSFLKKIFSGKILISFSSFYLATFFSFIFVFNLLSINKTEILFDFLIALFIFILVKFSILKWLKSELRYARFSSKRWIVLTSAFVTSLVYGVLFIIQTPNFGDLGYFEYLNAQNPTSAFSCSFLSEISAFSFYLNSSYIWLENAAFSEYKFVILLFNIFNKFLFFVALNHLFSLFFTTRNDGVKFGYFLRTIFTLAYVMAVFMFLNYINLDIKSEQKTPITKTEKLVKIVIKNGIKFDVKASDFAKFSSDTNQTLKLNLAKSKDEINSYIDLVYEKAALSLARKMSEFKYSVISDYIVLWHSVWDDNSTKFIEEKFSQFSKDSFDKEFEVKLLNLVETGVKRYENELLKNVQNLASSQGVGLNLDLNLTNFFSSQYHLNKALGTGAITAMGAGVAAKTLAKTASKTALKSSAKIATSSSAAFSGTVCGPAAVVCVPAFAVASWFGLDYVITKSDEILTKDEFEKEIYENVMSGKDEFKKELNLELDNLYSEILNSFYEVE
ncbi:hypothetical protein [Campylobacter geochelonis]|uniref:hypothetical protein n=1 Tax=Campylobacter geochelonis TaxID=1780362 RepID=UPI0007708BF7|nr:hypothetical protein [Campylobacter geochelonis]CZE48649.1 Uncharacterised protein [Campylobacter geochelonis]